jgi:DNA-binding response OmpR family regulator
MSPERPPRNPGSSGKDDATTTPEVLVVEDEAAVGDMLELALGQFGFTVYLARSGSQALEVFGRHGDTIEVVLLDVQMPELDGPGTLAALRRVNPSVPVVFMSGNTGRYSEQELLELGAARIFHKPFRLDELAQFLRQLAQGHSRPSP